LDDREGWERSDFPIVCETCLGDNPYIRMTKANFEKECKVCTRPFTVFRWKAGTKGRYKKTEICQVCAKLKNVCQTCLLDLTFNLPVQVRDSAMPMGVKELEVGLHQSNKNFFGQIALDKVKNGELPYARAQYSPAISAIARTEPYYDRNLAQVCSFYAKGNCNRGNRCPYRHEMPKEESELSKQNIRDRYYGVNDPVAKKILKRHELRKLTPPADPTIKTLYIGKVDETISKESLKNHFYYFGEITSINLVLEQNCAFIEFSTRESAEAAADEIGPHFVVEGNELNLGWSKPRKEKEEVSSGEPRTLYPSMDPNRLGSIAGPSVPEHLRRNRVSAPSSSLPTLVTPSVNSAPEVDED